MNNQDNAGTFILQTVLGLLLLVLGVIVVLLGGWGFEDENGTLWAWLDLATLPAAIALLPVWLTYRERKPSHCWLVFVVLAFLLMMVAVGGYLWHWEWTGMIPPEKPEDKQNLWDWLEVVLVPFALPIVSAWAADRYLGRAGSEETSPISAFAAIAWLSIPLAAMAVALALTVVVRDTTPVPNSPPVPAPTAPAPTTPQPEPLRVPAIQKWTPTEISVTRGQRLKITASGEVRPNIQDIQTRNLVVGPDGVPGPQRPDYNVLPGESNHAALIGRIDGVDLDTGKPFLIGREYTAIMDRSGVLVLGVNDTGVNNNSGEFTVNVVVTP